MVTENMSVWGVIVTYKPSAEHIERVVVSALKQVNYLVIVDNSCDLHTRRILEKLLATRQETALLSLHTQIFLVFNTSNVGLAAAMNQAIAMAQNKNADYVLILDQDSCLRDGAVRLLLAAIQRYGSRLDVGCVVATNIDLNRYRIEGFQADYSRRRGGYFDERIQEMFFAKNSGMLIPISTFKLVGQYREDYFVDGLDHEFCLRIREAGRHILWVRDAHIDHELGSPTRYRLWSLDIPVPLHAAWRYYYVARSTMMTTRDHIRRFPLDVSLYAIFHLPLFLAVLLATRERPTVFRFMIRGFADALRRRTGVVVLPAATS